MKKNRIYSVLVLLFVVITSCKRDYDCGCYYLESEPYENYNYTIHDTKDRAKDLCDRSFQDDPKPNTCVLDG